MLGLGDGGRVRRVAMLGLVLALGASVAACKSGAKQSEDAAPTTASVNTSIATSTTAGTGGTGTSIPSTATSAPSQTATEGASPAKAAFLDEGNQICAAMNSKSAALSDSYGPEGPQTEAEAKDLFIKNAELIEGSVAQLEALEQPPGDEEHLSQMYEEVMRLASIARQVAEAFGQGNEQAVQDHLSEGDTLQAKVNEEFTAYGLTDCGEGG